MRRLIAAAGAVAACAVTYSAMAQTSGQKPPMTPELQKIIDAAKTEKVMLSNTNPQVYGTQVNIDAAKAWIKQNFDVDLSFDVTNGGPFGVTGSKILTEFRAGQPSSYDIWTASVPQYDPLLKTGMFVKVPWQTLWPDRVVPRQIGGDGYTIAFSTGTPGILYNKATGADFAKIKTIDEFLKPEYKGRFGTTAFANGFDSMAAKTWEGEPKMLDYISKLGHQAQGILNCGGQDRVASGEFQALVLECSGSSAYVAQYGGKMGLAIPTDAAQLQYYDFLIPKHAQHPNAAILFVLYMLSEQGQRILSQYNGIDLDYYPETQVHKRIADFEAQGIQFRRIDYPWWVANPGVDQSSAKLGKALKDAIGG